MRGIPNRSIDTLTLRHFWAVSKTFKRNFYLSTFVAFYAILSATVAPLYIGKLLGALAVPHHSVTPYIIGFVVSGILGLICNGVGYSNFLALQPKVGAQLQAESTEMLMHRGMSFHNNQVSGKLVSDALDYPEAYQQISGVIVTSVIPFLVGIISGLIVITVSSPLMGLIMFIMSSVAIGSGVAFRKRMTPFRKRRIAALKDVTSHVADTIVNIQSVKTFAHEDEELTKHRKLGTILMNHRVHDWHMLAVDGTRRIAGLLSFEVVFIIGTVWLVRRDPSLLATGIFAFSYTITLTNRLFEIGTMIRTTEEALQLAEPVTIAFKDKPEVVDAPYATQLQTTKGAIELHDVSFYYSDNTAKNNVFENLSLSIQPGEKIGLVGPSGGGKSTITKLLLRFEDFQSGSISIDGQDITTVTQQSLRRAIAYVPQESLLFHRTIADNIRYGMTGATDDMMIQASKAAYAHDFIMSLPEAYETVVGERGVKLSGGQRQRIAIARAILKDAPILLLDEATSALDSESEQVIQAALDDLMKSRTAVVIAHRLSTIQRMDRIVVLENGQIIENGSHKQLLSQNGLYSRLWKRQSGGFIED